MALAAACALRRGRYHQRSSFFPASGGNFPCTPARYSPLESVLVSLTPVGWKWALESPGPLSLGTMAALAFAVHGHKYRSFVLRWPQRRGRPASE